MQISDVTGALLRPPAASVQDMRRWRIGLAVLVLLVVLGSAWKPAHAQDDAGAGSLDGLLEILQLKAKVAPAQPFVSQSRPKQEPHFIPVGTLHPDRTVEKKTPAEVAAIEAELDATRIRQQRRAGQVPPDLPLKQNGAKSAKNTVH